MSILCKFRQIRPFNRDFFEPLVIFCCNLSAWAQKWQRQWTETPASTEICDKTTFFGSIFIQNVQIWPKFNEFGPFDRGSFETLGHFLLYSISLSTKMTKTINTNAGKYRNLRQNNVFGSISIQNVQIWAKCRQIRLFQPVFFEPLVIFWCILSGWARKCPRTSRYSLISTEICDKTTELLRFRS